MATHILAAGQPALRIGLLTDLHYADRAPQGTRHYRETIPKLREAVERFNEARLDFAVELGDLIDEADTVEGEIGHLKTIEREFAKFKGGRHYVLGNHCVWTLTKEQFFANCAAKQPFYAFDRAGFHFVMLDACHRFDGEDYGARNFKWNEAEIPPAQREWLQADLKAAKLPVIVFVHQRLDVTGNYGIKSAPEVRLMLEASGKVLAVFQGHNHVNDLREIGRIPYCTLAAMVEGSGAEKSAYGILDVFRDGTLKVSGFQQQKSHELAARGATNQTAPAKEKD